MAQAVLCPVCNGEGKVRVPTMPNKEMITCHGCGGKGWVEIGCENPRYYPYPYPWYPDYPQITWTVTSDPMLEK